MINTPPNSKGNNAMLTQACEAAYHQYKVQIEARRSDYKNNPDAQNFFNEMDAFLDPLFSKLCEKMNAAGGIEEQKELLLKMIRSSFNEVMMVSDNYNISIEANIFIRNMINSYTEKLENQGIKAARFGKAADPAGTFQAIKDYMDCLNMVAREVNPTPAQELRQKHNIPAGPVTAEQRSMLLKESEVILRGLGEPFIDKEMAFQPDMMAVGLLLIMDPGHIKDLMNGPIGDMYSLPKTTQEKWSRLQRDYPDMATNVGQVIGAAYAAKGRGRATLQ